MTRKLNSNDKAKLKQFLGEVKEVTEKVVPHTPSKPKPAWAYSLREGGQQYAIEFPTTEEQIAKVKTQLLNPHNWRMYTKSPYGGDRAYTQVTCFPPFTLLRVAEVFLPTGEVWNSRKRTFIKPEKK